MAAKDIGKRSHANWNGGFEMERFEVYFPKDWIISMMVIWFDERGFDCVSVNYNEGSFYSYF